MAIIYFLIEVNFEVFQNFHLMNRNKCENGALFFIVDFQLLQLIETIIFTLNHIFRITDIFKGEIIESII